MSLLEKIKLLKEKRLDLILKMEAEYENMNSYQEEDLAYKLEKLNKELEELVVIYENKINNKSDDKNTETN